MLPINFQWISRNIESSDGLIRRSEHPWKFIPAHKFEMLIYFKIEKDCELSRFLMNSREKNPPLESLLNKEQQISVKPPRELITKISSNQILELLWRTVQNIDK